MFSEFATDMATDDRLGNAVASTRYLQPHREQAGIEVPVTSSAAKAGWGRGVPIRPGVIWGGTSQPVTGRGSAAVELLRRCFSVGGGTSLLQAAPAKWKYRGLPA
ncbi:hypothetical protein FQN55_006636 [Onygenales sp. PD_40]|nr:hypothetical protein FQN55_006636 [Onygenales sp. PD_40]